MTKALSLDIGFRYVGRHEHLRFLFSLIGLVDHCPGFLCNLRCLSTSCGRSHSQNWASSVLVHYIIVVGHHCDGKLDVRAIFLLADKNQGFGFVNKYKDMIGLRVVLGIFESGIYPGIAFLLSTWYTRCKCIQFINRGLANVMADNFRRRWQAVLRFLHHWLHCQRIRGYPSLWLHANGWIGW